MAFGEWGPGSSPDEGWIPDDWPPGPKLEAAALNLLWKSCISCWWNEVGWAPGVGVPLGDPELWLWFVP